MSEINVFVVPRRHEIKLLTVFTRNQQFLRLHIAKDQYFAGFYWSEITVFPVMCWRDNKYKFFAYVISQKWSKLKQKKHTHTEHCFMHLYKTACEIWSIFDKVHFWIKNLTPFFHRSNPSVYISNLSRLWVICGSRGHDF